MPRTLVLKTPGHCSVPTTRLVLGLVAESSPAAKMLASASRSETLRTQMHGPFTTCVYLLIEYYLLDTSLHDRRWNGSGAEGACKHSSTATYKSCLS